MSTSKRSLKNAAKHWANCDTRERLHQCLHQIAELVERNGPETVADALAELLGVDGCERLADAIGRQAAKGWRVGQMGFQSHSIHLVPDFIIQGPFENAATYRDANGNGPKLTHQTNQTNPLGSAGQCERALHNELGNKGEWKSVLHP
jgi:hypothetical protein